MDSKDSSLFCYESHFIIFPNLYLAERCPLPIENRPTVCGKKIQELTRFSFQNPTLLNLNESKR